MPSIHSTCVCCFLAVLDPTAALADEVQHDVGLRLGGAGMQHSISSYPNQDRPPYRFDYSNGAALGLFVGGLIGQRWRLEAEYSLRSHGLRESSTSGDLQVHALMANAYYLLPARGALQPYLGVGLGAARVGLRDYRVNGSTVVDGHGNALAYQLIAGLRYELSPRWALSADYRYLRTSDPLIDDVRGDVMETSVRSHALMLGVSRRF